jgi:hypothetical protein
MLTLEVPLRYKVFEFFSSRLKSRSSGFDALSDCCPAARLRTAWCIFSSGNTAERCGASDRAIYFHEFIDVPLAASRISGAKDQDALLLMNRFLQNARPQQKPRPSFRTVPVLDITCPWAWRDRLPGQNDRWPTRHQPAYRRFGRKRQLPSPGLHAPQSARRCSQFAGTASLGTGACS